MCQRMMEARSSINEVYDKLEDLFWSGMRIREDKKLNPDRKRAVISEIERIMVEKVEEVLGPAELRSPERWDDWIFPFELKGTGVILSFNFRDGCFDIIRTKEGKREKVEPAPSIRLSKLYRRMKDLFYRYKSESGKAEEIEEEMVDAIWEETGISTEVKWILEDSAEFGVENTKLVIKFDFKEGTVDLFLGEGK